MNRETILLFLLAAGLMLIAMAITPCFADNRGLDLTPRQMKIEQAVMHVIIHGIPDHKIGPSLGNKIATHKSTRLDMILAIDEASTRYRVPPMLLVAMAYREGSFTMAGIGALGEQSTFQMVGYVAEHIRKKLEPECELKTYRGAALCAAAWLDTKRDKCGSIEGSFIFYATGRRCEPHTGHIVWLVRDRFGIARKLEAETGYLEELDSLSLRSISSKNGKS